MSRRTDELICKAIIDELDTWRATAEGVVNKDVNTLTKWGKGFIAGIDRAKIIVENLFIDKDLDDTDD